MAGIISRMEQRSRLENPAVPISSANIVEALGLGESTPAGVSVNISKALGLTAFWNGVRVITQTVAMLPCEVFEQQGKRNRRADEHGVHRLVYTRPNPWMTPFIFKELRTYHCLVWGNSYCEIEYDNADRPIALWPLLPDRTDVEIVNGKKFYWTIVNGVKVWLADDRVLHVPGLGFDGLRGYNVIKIHCDSLGLSVATNQYGATFFGNSGRPSGLLVHPGNPNKEERAELRESWNQVHQGLTRAQRTAFMWGGMKFERISMPPEEAQFLESRSTQIEEVARILNINPILLQHTEKQTSWGSGVAQFLIAFGKFTIAPWVERDEDAMNWGLFSEDERGRFYVKYNMNALLRGDAETQAKVLEIEFRNSIINADEWRALKDDNPLPDGLGRTYYMPLNMAPVQQLINPEPDQVQPASDPVPAQSAAQSAKELRAQRSLAMRHRLRTAHLSAFEDAARRFVRRDVEGLRKAVKQAHDTDDPTAYLARWLDEFYPGQRTYVAQQMLPLVLALSAAIAAEASLEVDADAEPPEVDEFAREYTDNLARRETDSSIGQVKKLIAEVPADELADGLTTRADEWSEKRPAKVARNEVVRVSSGAARYAWALVGLGTIWRAGPNACELCRQMDGRRIGPKQYFLLPGESVSGGDSMGSLTASEHVGGPPLHQSCECGLVPG